MAGCDEQLRRDRSMPGRMSGRKSACYNGIMTALPLLDMLSDDQLIAETKRLVSNEREATAALLRALMELDARRLYLREGCSSLFTYCTQVLHLAEGAAYNRIEAARAARRYPAVLAELAGGSLTLTSIRLLAPHFTEDNHRELLEAARHKSKREVELLIATLRPKAPVPTVIRKLPDRPASAPQARAALESVAAPPLALREATGQLVPERAAPPAVAGATSDTTARAAVPAAPPAPASSPLSADRYKLQVTISHETHGKLRRAQDLLRHTRRSGDVAALLDRALTLLLADLERRRCAATPTPRQTTAKTAHTRHIPAAVRRLVWHRDQGRCAFVGATGRCRETGRLEFHHVQPFAEGGPATDGNIQLRCRAHNLYEASLCFGDDADGVREAAGPFQQPVTRAEDWRLGSGSS